MAPLRRGYLLFAIKLHSGRLADARDLVVVGSQAEFDRIEQYLHRGNPETLEEQIEQVLGRLEEDGFEDSFKGVFRQEDLPKTEVDTLIEFLRTQLDES